MFSAFRASYRTDAAGTMSVPDSSHLPSVNGLSALFTEFGGMSFNGGIYRVLLPAEIKQWTKRIILAFPEYRDVIPFGYDWLGRVFALDPGRVENGEPSVILLEPGTGEALEVPADLMAFHEAELIEEHDAALASSFFETWKRGNQPAPKYQECAGYKIPLFLGGADDASNLELYDVDVYWHLMGQALRRIRAQSR